MLKNKQTKAPAFQPTQSKSIAKSAKSELARLRKQIKVEAALERVRARAMAMRKSEQLTQVAKVMLIQLHRLGISDMECSINIVDSKSKNFISYGANIINKGDKVTEQLPILNLDDYNFLRAVTRKLETGQSNSSLEMKGPMLNEMLALWKGLKLAGLKNKRIQKRPKKLFLSWARIENLSTISILSSEKLLDDQKSVLKRMADTFSIAYTRFIDLQKAEAQIREAQIEAALERVRSKAMAMHKSDDVGNASLSIFDQLNELGISAQRCGIAIPVNEDVMEFWAATVDDDGNPTLVIGRENFDLHPALRKAYRAWEAKEETSTHILKGKDLVNYYRSVKKTMPLPDWQEKMHAAKKGVEYFYTFPFTDGWLYIFDSSALSAAQINLIIRFSKVFDLTYRRFQDLQKAETQAREAQIEAALERVRASTMAMHQSEDVANATHILFDEIEKLGIESLACGLNIIYESRQMETWSSTKRDKKVFQISGRMKMKGHPSMDKLYKDWKEKRKTSTHVLIGREVRKFYNTIYAQVEYRTPKLKKLPKKIFMNNFIIPEGSLWVFSFEEIDKENAAILGRFANVFSLTYRRYKDLQKAEAQVRESQIQLALERVRARTMAMQSSEELADVSFLLNKQVVELGIPTRGCAFNIYNEHDSTEWFSSLDGTLPTYKTPREKIFLKYYKGGQRGEMLLVKEFSGKKIKEHYKYLFKAGIFGKDVKEKTIKTITPEFQIDHVAYFKYGYLLFITLVPAPDAHDVFVRFAKEFEQTYTRFLDLQKAEVQAREAKIEAALERIRAASMAMHNSNELIKVVRLMDRAIRELEVDINGIQIVTDFSDIMKGMNIWLAVEGVDYLKKFHNPYIDHPTHHKLQQALKDEQQFFTEKYSRIDKNRFLRFLYKHSDFKKIPKERKEFTLNALWWVRSSAINKNSILAFQRYYDKEFDEKENEILKRFGKAFEQSYTRFLDLKKAEAQAREARIEAALERIRSRSMAMHKSEELLDVITVVAEQLEQLDFRFNHVSFANNDIEQDYHFWVSAPGLPNPMRFNVPYKEIAIFIRLREAQRKGVEFYTDILTKKENKQWHKHLLKHSGANVFPEDVNEYAMSRGMARSVAINPNIILIVANYASIPYSENENKIINRFGQVFEQSYTRFLDLKKAEASARESQIEAALERVRGKTIAMHKSEDLLEVINVVSEQLQQLGVKFHNVSFGINSKGKDYHFWMSSPNEPLPYKLEVPYMDNPMPNRVMAAQKKGLDFFADSLTREECLLWHEHIFEYSGVSFPQEVKSYIRSKSGYSRSTVLMKNIFLTVGNYAVAQYSEEENELFRRFANVFEQSYIRFLDLQKAEKLAREATKQSSLDRVRAEIASMRSTSDLEKITPLIWNELKTLGVPFIRCGVFIMDEANKIIHNYLSTPEGKSIAAFHLPYDTPGFFSRALKNWREKKIYIDHLDKTAFVEIGNTLVQQGAFKSKDEYLNTLAHDDLHAHFLPFLQGMLYVANEKPLSEEEIGVVRSLAEAFSAAYSRYDDFNRLEDAKGRIENTLVELKAAQSQLIQSEKMASLGELTAGIAHEIQNPLNFVNNFSEVSNELLVEMKGEIEKGNVEEVKVIAEDVIHNLEKILHHGKRADGIVKGMLQHSRSSSGQKESTNINALADEYLRLAYHGLRAKDKSFNAKFETRFDANIEKVNVVPQDIGRVILNLITNAFYVVTERKKISSVDYEPQVIVSTRKQNGQVEISVIDNGSGIPDSVKEKIFQPFFTTKPTGQGTGLGLSLSYDIVKAHGGEIKIESKEGEGSTFTIQLPLV